MAHHASRSVYERLTERLNRSPQGAPPSRSLFEILRLLFSEREAELVSVLPLKPFTVAKAAAVWKTTEAEARKVLEALAARALLVDIEGKDGFRYVLPPPMAGFFEFSMMRVRGDLDQKALAELFYQYLNVEEDFVRALFAGGETQLGRTFVNEEAVAEDDALHVLDYERASEVIRTARHRAVGLCYCRHKMQHLGRACDAPQDICMTFNVSAASLVRHGHARAVDVAEGLDLLQQARDRGLVQFGENVRESVNFICNCCGCCCEAMIAARKFAVMHPIHTTAFLPAVDERACNGCEKCVRACPVEALSAVSANDARHPKRTVARLDEERCLGCGVCVRACTPGAIALRPRARRRLTPLNGAHRAVLMAIERGKLQELVFDDRVLFSHRALAALLGVVLRLPPAKRLLATEQVRSRYLEALCRRA
ncbi:MULTISPECIES: 4Fe-4S dicluster domain-containing protein [Anaeromyxobacter]|uniref:4Fe-4S dicluster domain-containing protein n=1 Tax=Anaeromyxobacter TaxID=161492 RepID=UPI001F5A0141|nr:MULTISPECIES: 4Fe-4S dicluster domain-containing protein [unclassified Anaeromyxobacter]